jgi:hypothetical protein
MYISNLPNIVLLFNRSQFEEMSGMETPPRPTQTISMDPIENPRTPLAANCNKVTGMQSNIQEVPILPSDVPSSSQDISGMMKIVPSELDVSSLACIIIQKDVLKRIILSKIIFLLFHSMPRCTCPQFLFWLHHFTFSWSMLRPIWHISTTLLHFTATCF